VPATIVAIADAVVAELNGTTFSQAFTAVRHYQPVFELSEMMTELKVSVVPRGVASKALDRNRHEFDYRIDVAVQHKIEPTQGNLDALMELVEEISDHFRTQPLAGYPEAHCVEVANEPVYAMEHLDELRQFTSVLTLTYRVWR
jgi:hypothetical protein